MRPITKLADACYETRRISEYIEVAVRTALSGIPGPSFLEIPIDVLSAQVPEGRETVPPFRDYRVQHAAPRANVEIAVDLLREATHPLVMAGTSLKWSEGSAALQRFVEATAMPCYSNGMGRGMLAMDHPQFFNRTRGMALAQADVVVLAGTVLDFRMKFGRSIPASAKIVQLDLDETLIGQNRPADIGLVGNLGANLLAMLDVLESTRARSSTTPPTPASCARRRSSSNRRCRRRCSPTRCRSIRCGCARRSPEVITDDMIVIGDGGDIVAQASKVVKVPKNGAWMDPGPLGTLGVGMPFALAAQIAHPDKRVMIIYGDGSFGLNGFEFDTAVRFGLPIVGVVGNDAAWGQMLRPQSTVYGEDRIVATRLNYTRYDKVVEAMGGHGEHVTKPEDIRPALERALASGKPALVNVEMRQDVGQMKGSTYV